ncbi:hypothetical protein PV726_23605 [Streptomyces europaeiscabiei]|uniref:hypothetical protein n=1 Tax=Streptomyces europaeiscabiei TaxID=146819 RepID=UPI0029A32786|nr:hypothetical protein [Streptomyces europaeiscabiei]MDX3693279.1 hypothetical protein [Streptomyces europaeiscabiei]
MLQASHSSSSTSKTEAFFSALVSPSRKACAFWTTLSVDTSVEWMEYRSSTTLPSVVTPTKSAYFTALAPGPMPPPPPPGAPEGMPFGAAEDEDELAVPDEPDEQPVIVATAATPPASSALFMNQRRVRWASGVRGRWPWVWVWVWSCG